MTRFREPGAQQKYAPFPALSGLSKLPQSAYVTIAFVGWGGVGRVQRSYARCTRKPSRGHNFPETFIREVFFLYCVPKSGNLSQGVPERSVRLIYELISTCNWILMKNDDKLLRTSRSIVYLEDL